MKKRLISFMLLITVISCVGFNTDYFKNLLTLISQAAKEVIYEETESCDEETTDSAVDRLEQELEKLDVRNFFEEESETESGKYSADFDDLAAYRRQQGMPVAGSIEDKHTAAKLIIGDNVYYGRNGHGKQNEVTSVFTVNPQTATHAEGDVFYQAKMDGNTNTTAVLIIDRYVCRACGFNGGIRSLAKQMGITDLTIVCPNHDPINFNPQVKPIPNPFK